MSFVPQPFDQVADELLTALTGGTVREEHLYRGPDSPYPLGVEDALVETLVVTGEREERFIRFERGLDYDLGDDGALRWRSGGRTPDERTRFHCRYYRRESLPRLTDRSPGSVTGTLARSFAREVAVVQQQLDGVYRAGFVDLAEGSALDQVAALLALTRRDARFARGEVLFRRASPAPGDIAIPSGTLVSTAQGERFETTDRRLLRRGQLAVTAPIRALTEGAAGRAARDAITVVDRPVFGIDAVTNPEATYFASERETDEEFRRRARGALERAGRSTVEAIRRALLDAIPGLDDSAVQVRESTEPGLVQVRLGLGTDVDEQLIRRVEAAILDARPAGVRVTHNLRLRGGVGAAPTLPPRAAAVRPRLLDAADLSAAGEDIVSLTVSAFIQLADPAATAADRDRASEGVRQRVVEHLEALPMGADLVYNKLVARVLANDEIADAIVRVAVVGGTGTTYDGNIALAGRKARVAPAHVDVRLLAEPVQLDVAVTLSGSRDEILAGDHPWVAAARAATERTVAAAHDAVTWDALRDAINAALDPLPATAQGPRARLMAGAAGLSLSALYEETGRTLAATQRVDLAEHHAPVLRGFTVRVAGGG